MTGVIHDCGAPLSKHPTSGYSEGGACHEALRASNVKTPCEWPGCTKRVRKFNLGHNFCGPHGKVEFAAFMGILRLEGPSSLNRRCSTIAERYEFAQTGTLPASRLVPVTFENTNVYCGTCGAGLVVVNDPDWSPDLPNSMSTRDDGTAWGIGICRCCSGPNCRHCLWHGEMVDGHTPGTDGVCQRCRRHCGVRITEELAAPR